MNPISAFSIPRFYTEAFKQEVLGQLSKGRGLQELSRSTGVSITSLVRWKRLAEGSFSSQPPVCTPSDIRRSRRVYSDQVKQNVLSMLLKGSSIAQVAQATGVSAFTLYRWKLIAEVASTPVSNDTIETTALDWVEADECFSLIDLDLAKSIELRNTDLGNLEPVVAPKSVPPKRWKYDVEFKNRALLKLERGLSFPQVSCLMGVSMLTLHRWKKEADAIKQESIDPSTKQSDEMNHLLQQLREVEQQRDVLKKVLVILSQSI